MSYAMPSSGSTSAAHWSGLPNDKKPHVTVDPNLPFEARRQLVRDLRLAAMRAAVLPQADASSRGQNRQDVRQPSRRQMNNRSPSQGYSSTHSADWPDQHDIFSPSYAGQYSGTSPGSLSGYSQLDNFERQLKSSPGGNRGSFRPTPSTSRAAQSSPNRSYPRARDPAGAHDFNHQYQQQQDQQYMPQHSFSQPQQAYAQPPSAGRYHEGSPSNGAANFIIMSPQQLVQRMSSPSQQQHQQQQQQLVQLHPQGGMLSQAQHFPSGVIEIHHHHHHHYYDGNPSRLQVDAHTAESKPMSRTSPVHVASYKSPTARKLAASNEGKQMEEQKSSNGSVNPRTSSVNTVGGKSKTTGAGGFVHLAEAMAPRDAQTEREDEEDEDNDDEDEDEDEMIGKGNVLNQAMDRGLHDEPNPEQAPDSVGPSVQEAPSAQTLKQHESEAQQKAAASGKQEEPADPRFAMTSFGDRLKEASMLKVQRAGKGSKLPRYSSTVDLKPSRPPAEIPSPKMSRAASSSRAESSSSSQAVQRPRGGPQAMEGWLSKMSRKSRWLSSSSQPKWKKRYFRLTNKMLICFKDQYSQTPKQILSLEKIEVETDLNKIGKTPTKFAMLVYEMGRSKDGFRICASDYRTILSWFHMIVHNALCSQNQLSPQPPRDPRPVDPAASRKKSEESERPKMPEQPPPKAEDFYPQYVLPATHYDIIGVQPTAERKEIRKQFYKLAACYHPDKNPDADPAEFAMLSQAYTVLYDEQLRAKYDLGERICEVLRRGFDCVMYTPTKYIIKDDVKIPSEIASRRITLFTDGELTNFFYQPATKDEFLPLKPELANSFESRFIEYIIYGRNHRVIRQTFLNPIVRERREAASLPEDADEDAIAEFEAKVLREVDRYVVFKGKKLQSEVYLELDSPEVCKDLIDGLRIIRCEKSVLFAQRLEKLQTENGFD
ncbi:DnaJ family protein [Hondaea fermentalgiana]|uniref:DnaJ family protein n=1 Tax=Hondaea fermentalgiana TaxID=2315210 RepID=A0A2R5GBQ1_9STRA|nr:DnaJ family protein [Hondaea fermentalgiana]|eukprot:GBG28420.1 DnaJ family protein [Hondaea fermentalgiana]